MRGRDAPSRCRERAARRLSARPARRPASRRSCRSSRARRARPRERARRPSFVRGLAESSFVASRAEPAAPRRPSACAPRTRIAQFSWVRRSFLTAVTAARVGARADGRERDALHLLVGIVDRAARPPSARPRCPRARGARRLHARRRVRMPRERRRSLGSRLLPISCALAFAAAASRRRSRVAADERLEAAIAAAERIQHRARAIAGRLQRGQRRALDRLGELHERRGARVLGQIARHELIERAFDVERRRPAPARDRSATSRAAGSRGA